MAYKVGSPVRRWAFTLIKPRSSTLTLVFSKPISFEFGMRPTETKTLSKICSVSITFFPSKVTLTPFSTSTILETVVLSIMSLKWLFNFFCKTLTKSRSASGNNLDSISTMVTSEPSAA